MNSLVIPPSPNWYESTVFACAPDNTVIYGSRADLVVIKPADPSQPADVKIINRAHQDKIVAVAVSPTWGKKKLVVSLAADKVVKLWNMEECVLQSSHRAHTANSTEVVGVTFAGNDRIVSASVDGVIVVWRFGPNELILLKDVLGSKQKVTCLSVCPHLNWLVAFGMNSGLVIVTDLRKSGRVLYRLRRHDEAIVSFSWCPSQHHILQNQEKVVAKATTSTEQEANSETSAKTRPAESSTETTEISNIEKEKAESDLIILDIPPSTSANAEQETESVQSTSQANPAETSTETTESLKIDKVKTVKQLNRGQETKSVEKQGKPDTPLRASVKTKKSNPWADLIPSDNKKLNESRPIPQHFDVSGDFFAEEVSFFDDQHKIGNLDNLESGPEEKKPVLETENKEDDFLAACAALKKQILLNKEPNDDSKLKKPNSLAESLETVNEQLAKVDLGTNKVSNKSQISTVESVEDKEKTISEGETKGVETSPSDEKSAKVDKAECSTKSDNKGVLLASSTRGGNLICIWSVGKQGRLQAELHLSGRSQTYKRKGSSGAWIALLWITPNLLLSSSKNGELLSWDLKKIKGKGHDLKPSLMHNDHTTQLFCITAPIDYNKKQTEKEKKEEHWREDNDLRVWTIGQDRYILNTNLGASREVFISYPTIGAPIQCMVTSPLDPNRVAIGMGDGTGRVWDLSKPHLQCITMTKLWQKIYSKILALAWHPSKEAILAYGTNEGRIGVVDTLHLSKPPVLMSQYFNKGVYQLQWGPLQGQPDVGLYASSEGKVVVYNSEKPIEDPCVIPNPEGEQITQFSWNQCYNILVLGAKSGTIFFYSPDFKLLHKIYHQRKAVQCLVWHPEAFVEGSTYFAWLASATNDNSFVIYNCSCLINSDGGGDKEVNIVADLLGHSSSVRCLCWSPHEGNKLVSVGEDSIAQVWDVSSQTIIATYLGHENDGLLAVVWSPLDPDFIISGGKDNALRVWKVSDCPPIDVTVLETAVKSKIKSTKSGKSEEDQTRLVPTAVKGKKVLDPVSRFCGGGATIVAECRRLFEMDRKETTNTKTYKLDALDVFKTRDDVLKLLDCEEKGHLNSGKRLQAHHISLWKGDIAETVKQAIIDGTVTPFLISLAPMVSPKLWQEACEVYSNKLIESTKGDPLEAAAYFLACHKVEQAVEALVSGGFYREALALAKSRLGEEDTLVTSILERWATTSMFDGNFETAAQCYIALGKLEEAVKLLFRRSDEVTLKLALDIAESVNNEELHKAVLVRYNAFKSGNKEEKAEANASESEEVLDSGGCNNINN